jgi:hypothetical protein
MTTIAPEKVDKLVLSPIVSENPTSMEAILMKDAKKIEAQANTDTKFDATVERFRGGGSQPISVPLMGVAVALGLLSLSIFFNAKRR